jgi:hypothetical protein
MSRLTIPLLFRTLRATGDVLLRGELTLAIKTNKGTWEELPFRADPGTEMTTMPAAGARQFDLPFPRQPVPGLVMGGQEVRAGLIRAQVMGLDATEYIFPCYFLGDPSKPLPVQPRNLLGLTGVIDKLRISFDGRPAMGVPYGYLVVEKQ